MPASRVGVAVLAALVTLSSPAAMPTTQPAGEPDGLIGTSEPGWPQWRGPRRDGICPEKGLLESWPADGPRLLWIMSGLGRGYSSPIIARDRIYITGDVGGDLVVWALDMIGKPVWKAVNGAAWKGPYPGARASCLFDADRLYHMNAHGRVVCLDARSGKEVWAVNVLDRFDGQNITWGLSECLLADGKRLIVTPGGRKAVMAALDRDTGDTVWACRLPDDDGANYASPILFRYGGRRHLVNYSSRHAFGVDADTGRLLWRHHRPTNYQVIAAMPVYHDGTVFLASPDGKEGELLRLVVAGQDVRAEPVWSSVLENCTGGVVLVDGMLYTSGYRRLRGWVGADIRTGRVTCRKEDLDRGSVLYADGRLYCLSERGEMALLKTALGGRGGLEQVGRFRLVHGNVSDAWAHPVILDGRLYLRYHETLWCYDVRGGQ